MTVLFAEHPEPLEPLSLPNTRLVPVRYARASTSLFYSHDHGQGAPSRLSRAPLSSAALALSFSANLLVEARASLDRCDALLSHFALPSSIIAAIVRRSRPHYAIVHGSDAALLAKTPRALQRALAKQLTAIQFAHPGLRAGLDPSWSKHPHAHDLPMAAKAPSRAARAARSALREKLGVNPDQMCVLSLGRLAREKSLHTLIDAALSLDASRVKLVVAGDGPARAALEQHARGRASFVGAVDPGMRDALLCASDVFALSSQRDSAPTTVLEALAAGLPIVATRVGGVPWLVGEAGLIVERDDPSAFAAALGQMLDPERRASFARAALDQSAAWPSWDGLAAHILHVVGAIQ